MTPSIQPPAATPDIAAATAAVVDAYPGPCFRVTAERRLAETNAAARELMEHDSRWLPMIAEWLESAPAAPGLRSVPIDMPRGMMVVEWAAAPLADGGVLLFGRDSTLERQLRQTLTESRQRYKDLVEASSDFAWETGPDGRFVFVTPRGALGYSADALIGRDPRDLAIDEWDDLPLPFDTRRPVDQSELWLKTVDGTPACVVASALPLYGPDGGWAGARGVCREVTEQVLRSAELARVRNREKLLAHIVHTLRDRLDAAQALDEATAETARALGAEGCRIYRRDGDRLELAAGFGADEVEALIPAVLERAGADPLPVVVETETIRVLASRTEYRQAVNGAVLVWRGTDSDGWDEEDRQLVAGVADHLGIAHAHLAYQERLRRLSERDGLTSLFNRRTFFERLEEALDRPETGPSALLYVDLDNFKAVNDLHGHQAGDEVLRAIGKLLTSGVRPGDLPGRLGGDEFVLWVGRTDADGATVVANRLLSGIRELGHLSASPEKPLGLSIGIAVHIPGRGETVKDLTDRADAAMYAAKAAGKGNYAIAPDAVPAVPQAETIP
ncbi:diguanylate cyclase [Azospirillum sp. RWY-5-1]|uniref:Diguanylate cyclase n=1 Tax=Azospirillum oleiclasticum TaxID=2735135 RepID=A0ABX2TMB5_9PROT|nr:diguanylate cyclase [Azospirillum oleiclasticum]NYZ16844.1 diguanylate cyclase [Azospirillum oleiclasticum]NYZ24423.1 diguanylate cyclase [Azospirillum oleiclasticum]